MGETNKYVENVIKYKQKILSWQCWTPCWSIQHAETDVKRELFKYKIYYAFKA